MDTLHIVKTKNENYCVYYNNRETEYESLGEAVDDNVYSRYLRDYIFEIFRHTDIKRLSVWGFGDWWWAEAETEGGDLLEEEGSSPLKATAALLLSIEARDE